VSCENQRPAPDTTQLSPDSVLCGLLDVNLGSGPPKSWLRSFWWLLLVVAAGLQLYTVQEALAKTADTHALLRGDEFYELCLFEEPNELGTRHCVRRTHAVWSESNHDVIRESEEADYFWLLKEAKRRYAERRRALVQQGFIYSDMDWWCRTTMKSLGLVSP
jgi:hypothetical protein